MVDLGLRKPPLAAAGAGVHAHADPERLAANTLYYAACVARLRGTSGGLEQHDVQDGGGSAAVAGLSGIRAARDKKKKKKSLLADIFGFLMR